MLPGRTGRLAAAVICGLLLLAGPGCSAPVPTPTRAPTATPIPTATPRSARTVEQITAALATSKFMDARHAAKGVACAACHAQSPAAAPDSRVCLGCHGGSYTALGEKTAGGKYNPHRSHQGDLPCADCHHGHEPFTLYCADCHNEFRSDRFQ